MDDILKSYERKAGLRLGRRSLILGSVGFGAMVGLPLYWFNRWNGLTIHHSAGSYGDIEFLRQVHRDRQAGDPIDEIPYHFLIGNGNGLALGEVVETGRWERQLWGAHLSENNIVGNFRSIGICLIGNFETDMVPDAQLAALVSLSRGLVRRFGMAQENVNLHGHTPGEATKCPGRNFPKIAFFEAVFA